MSPNNRKPEPSRDYVQQIKATLSRVITSKDAAVRQALIALVDSLSLFWQEGDESPSNDEYNGVLNGLALLRDRLEEVEGEDDDRIALQIQTVEGFHRRFRIVYSRLRGNE